MPLLIGDKAYSGKLSDYDADELIYAIKQLPKPHIVGLEESRLCVNAQTTLLCLEQEVVQLTEAPSSVIKHVGSKNVQTCILVYLYGGGRHVCIHINSRNYEELSQHLAQFNMLGDLSVIIVGGLPDSIHSKDNLLHIVEILLLHTEESNIDITIKKQLVLENNVSTRESYKENAFDFIIKKLNEISEIYFNKPLDADFINSKNVKLFKEIKIEHTTKLKQLVGLIEATEYWITEKNMRAVLKRNTHYLSRELKDEHQFLTLASSLFSIEGWKLIKRTCKIMQISTSRLSNFVFDIKTRRIYTISRTMSTPKEGQRALQITEDHKYFVAHQGVRKYTPVVFSEKSQTLVRRIRKAVREKKFSKEIVKLYNEEPTMERNYFIKHTLRLIRSHACQPQRHMLLNSYPRLLSKHKTSPRVVNKNTHHGKCPKLGRKHVVG